MLPAYGNQLSDLHCKSFDWFLYKGHTVMKKVNKNMGYLAATHLADFSIALDQRFCSVSVRILSEQ